MVAQVYASRTEEHVVALDLVTFRLDKQTYALPVQCIQQIIGMVTITPFPKVDANIEGAIDYHGIAVPVANMRRLLDLPIAPLHLHTPIIIASLAGRLFGLIVDEVLDIWSRPAHDLIRPDEILPRGMDTALIKGLLRARGGVMVPLIDPEHLLDPSQARTLAKVVDVANTRQRLSAKQAAVEEIDDENADDLKKSVSSLGRMLNSEAEAPENVVVAPPKRRRADVKRS
jgi:purine-binding chemotaxis protein CheW